MSSTSILFLVGIKHSGKSALGRLASSVIPNATFYDSDDYVIPLLAPPYTSIRQFYGSEGQAAFMALELEAVKSILQQAEGELAIIALGGGACDNTPLITLMQRVGKIIYLQVDSETLFKRIVKGGLPPFLDSDDPASSFDTLYRQRDAQYRKLSDYVLQLSDCRSVEENGLIVAKLLLEVAGSEDQCQKTVSEQPLK
ncbi:MAG: shikimate kinase [Sphaerochaetaceae bacterium]|jgi:shikimate kinase|nr:shikimate kinase [Sphaerochaetaceae bacterium]HHU88328.1 hypothetical protein [Spirochaetales bacterium]